MNNMDLLPNLNFQHYILVVWVILLLYSTKNMNAFHVSLQKRPSYRSVTP